VLITSLKWHLRMLILPLFIAIYGISLV